MLIKEYGEDLCILPESIFERTKITNYLDKYNYTFNYIYSSDYNHDWYGKTFINIPFGNTFDLKLELDLL